ncbi:acyl-CoA dehydrogenase family protein [Sphaerisporangium rubeum]|uniref:3-hydroxy-9,10-secoandrosta-1,3,5(10)-triene-9, 17-dione monooxygenase n=1 Tax=Sphaerisporangium rubeum TaxID=321317 RepID=A0A7X0ICV4_9ACTN|nr:acyl-CoA dehydrogenase family protein [Sphaerisporangium rubeum]MBB6472660.1 3-hydroxy-9,10-secoandrosta-1,3,5(10)-triene-9,17-dione monooxygenase [Sphaerisporangium rubeum]
MSVITDVRDQGVVPPPEPGLTPDEVVARAEALIPLLVKEQAATEARTYYSEDVHERFSRAGFYRILVPRRYGGYEFGVDTFMRVAMTLTRGCPSTGWMFTLGAAHALAAATLLGERAQDEVFAGGEFISPATVMPSGTAERVEGGWRISGTWAYCSGAPYATHFMGHTLVPYGEGEPPMPMFFMVPRSDFRRLDDWGGQLGLKGSGSHSIVIDDAFVPDHRTIASHISGVSVTEGTPGLRLHGNPLYGGGPLSFMILESAVLAVGMAQGMLDAYAELMVSRTTSFPPITGRAENPDFQFWYGEASAKIDTAEGAIRNALRVWTETCAKGSEHFTREQELRIATIGREAVRLSWDAVQRYLFPTAGSSSVRNGERVERIWRDMSTLHSHAGIAVYLSTMANRELAMARFGIEDPHH